MKVFVYGTLRRGQSNHGLLAKASSLGLDATLPAWTLHHLGDWPALAQGGSTAVVGELYEVDAPTLAELDALEEVPTVYQRIPILLRSGRDAMVYVMPAEALTSYPVIDAGDWAACASKAEPES
jgi:gamma-glutamylaminecyclotransferase